MKTGIIAGFIFSALLLTGCYFLLGAGAVSCGPGYGFLLSPAILITTIICAALFLKNKSVVIASAAKIVLATVTIALLISFGYFFG